MKDSQVKWTRYRLYLILAFFVLIWGAILYRAAFLQILERDKLVEIAQKQGNKVVKMEPIRGDIFDRHGEKLAVSLETDSVFVQPNRIEDPVDASTRLAKVTGLDQKVLMKKLKEKDSFAWIKRQIGPDETARIEALNIKGVGFVKENRRFYPNNFLASHVLGFVGVDGKGLEGIEAGADEYLRGEANEWKVKRDALGRTFLFDRGGVAPEKMKGANIQLTLDRRVQYVAETSLARAVETYGAKGGLVLVLRPKTGEILASAVYPSFNPNVFGHYSAIQRRNKIFTDAFDPGSTFKVFIVAAALEENLFKPADILHCENGLYVIDNRVIHDVHPYGRLSVAQIIQKSSNIGAAKIGDKVGVFRLHRYLSNFSFGDKTGIDFPGESGGLLRQAKNWRKIDAANVAFGQGVSVTALQMTVAIASIANDGVMMKPYIVSQITDADGQVVKKGSPEVLRQVVSPQTARMVKDMLRLVVLEGGTGVKADSKGYPAAGKTGTAQKLDHVTKTYSDRKYVSSFLGFVPFDDPQLAMMVALDEPSNATYGGTVAAPVFKEIAEQTLPMLNVPPVRPQLIDDPVDSDQLRSASNKKSGKKAVVVEAPKVEPAMVMTDQPSNKLTVKVDQKVVKTAVAVGREIAKAETAPIEQLNERNSEKGDDSSLFMTGVMPNVSGLSMRRVMDLMAKHQVSCNFIGSGQAVSQKPQPGSALQEGQVCQIKFEQR